MSVVTYYFDGSDAAATDPNNVWTNEANVFDNDATPSTFATTLTAGSTASNYVMAEGTSAPGSGGGITQVRARIFADNNGIADQFNAAIYTDGLGELLGTPINTSTSAAWGSYTTLSTPTGGWSWAKLQALEVKAYYSFSDTPSTSNLYKIELEVTSSADQGSAPIAWLRA